MIVHEANNREPTQSSRSLPFVATLRVLEFLLDGYYRKKLLGGSCILRPAPENRGYYVINIAELRAAFEVRANIGKDRQLSSFPPLSHQFSFFRKTL